MAEVTIEGTTVSTNGELPKVGDQLPAFTLADAELKDVTLDDFAGKRIVLNIFPSVDRCVGGPSVRAGAFLRRGGPG